MFANSMSQGRLDRKLKNERDLDQHKIQELQGMVGSENVAVGETDDTPVFQKLLYHPNYVTHFVARPDHSISRVMVVIWNRRIAGPAMIHEGLCIVYVYCNTTPSKICSLSWGILPPAKKVYSPIDMEKAARVNAIIEEHQSSLFGQHSSLVALKSSGPVEGVFYIDCVVLAKNFVPIKDRMQLPRFVGGVPTRVVSGIVTLCGRRELSFHRPLLPGAGFAAGPDALLDLDIPRDSFRLPMLGTLGGTYRRGDDVYGVICAHSVALNGSKDLYPAGTPIFQPSTIALVLTAVDEDVKEVYEDVLEREGAWYAANWLMDRAGPAFRTDLPEGANCGAVYGGVYGPLGTSSTAVDCALIKLDTEMAHACHQLPDALPVCPELRLGDGATTPLLDIRNPPPGPASEFRVFGQGAMSSGLMSATVDPAHSHIWYRVVTDGSVGDLTFTCVYGKVRSSWTAGDSGTWCWTEDGKLVGMGMAYAQIENLDYCCMLPMNDVVAAIEHMLA